MAYQIIRFAKSFGWSDCSKWHLLEGKLSLGYRVDLTRDYTRTPTYLSQGKTFAQQLNLYQDRSSKHILPRIPITFETLNDPPEPPIRFPVVSTAASPRQFLPSNNA